MKMTAWSPIPASDSSTVSTPVAASVSAAPIATSRPAPVPHEQHHHRRQHGVHDPDVGHRGRNATRAAKRA